MNYLTLHSQSAAAAAAAAKLESQRAIQSNVPSHDRQTLTMTVPQQSRVCTTTQPRRHGMLEQKTNRACIPDRVAQSIVQLKCYSRYTLYNYVSSGLATSWSSDDSLLHCIADERRHVKPINGIRCSMFGMCMFSMKISRARHVGKINNPIDRQMRLVEILI